MKTYCTYFCLLLFLALCSCKNNTTSTNENIEEETSDSLYLLQTLVFHEPENNNTRNPAYIAMYKDSTFCLDSIFGMLINNTWRSYLSEGKVVEYKNRTHLCSPNTVLSSFEFPDLLQFIERVSGWKMYTEIAPSEYNANEDTVKEISFNELIRLVEILYREPGESILGLQTNDLYFLMRQNIRDLLMDYKLINQAVDIHTILEEYTSEIHDGPYIESMVYNYDDMYSDISQKIDSITNEEYWVSPLCVGRWYRRYREGTYRSFAKLLERIVGDYDRKWYIEQYLKDGVYATNYQEQLATVTNLKTGEELYENPSTLYKEQVIYLPAKYQNFKINSAQNRIYFIHDSVYVYSLEPFLRIMSFPIDIENFKLDYQNKFVGEVEQSHSGRYLFQQYSQRYDWKLFIFDCEQKKAIKFDLQTQILASIYPIAGVEKVAISQSSGTYIYSETSEGFVLDGAYNFLAKAAHPRKPILYSSEVMFDVESKKTIGNKYRYTSPEFINDSSFADVLYDVCLYSLDKNNSSVTYIDTLVSDIESPNELYALDKRNLLIVEDGVLKVFDITKKQFLGKPLVYSATETFNRKNLQLIDNGLVAIQKDEHLLYILNILQ